jgi:ethanolamine utilization protein EutQ (cupin superfamily)
MTTCVEQCAREFAGDLDGLFGRVLTRAECERMAVKCDPCNPETCAVTQLLKKQHGQRLGSGFGRLTT